MKTPRWCCAPTPNRSAASLGTSSSRCLCSEHERPSALAPLQARQRWRSLPQALGRPSASQRTGRPGLERSHCPSSLGAGSGWFAPGRFGLQVWPWGVWSLSGITSRGQPGLPSSRSVVCGHATHKRTSGSPQRAHPDSASTPTVAPPTNCPSPTPSSHQLLAFGGRWPPSGLFKPSCPGSSPLALNIWCFNGPVTLPP